MSWQSLRRPQPKRIILVIQPVFWLRPLKAQPGNGESRCKTALFLRPQVLPSSLDNDVHLKRTLRPAAIATSPPVWFIGANAKHTKRSLLLPPGRAEKPRNLSVRWSDLAAVCMNGRFSAAWQRGRSRICRILFAASARSEKTKFTEWALRGHAAVQKNVPFRGYLNVNSRWRPIQGSHPQRMTAIRPSFENRLDFSTC